MSAPISSDTEELRQQTLQAYQLDRLAYEPAFDRIARLTSDLFETPISAITVLSREQQLLQGACGLNDRTTKRDDAFCNLAVASNHLVVIEDAVADPRFANNPLVIGPPHIRFYAGAPLKIGDGVAVGSLCIIDRQPRTINAVERMRLIGLAEVVSDLMELRLGSRLARERQAEIARQAELLRATIDNVQQGIAVIDRDLRLILWNDQIFELLGIEPPSADQDYSIEEFFRSAAAQGSFGFGDPIQIVSGLLASMRSTDRRRLELSGPAGRVLHAWRATLKDGRYILTIEDVTEQRRTGQMKDEFVSTVSHELRTPLTSIRGALMVLSRKAGEVLDSSARQLLDMALRNSERLTHLINDILDVEKLTTGTLPMHREPVDVADVLRDACEQNQPFADQHGVSLELKVQDRPLQACGDRSRLLQVITNLLSNACKFSPRGSVVSVSGSEETGYVRIDVADQGKGIPAEFQPHVFRRFAQADPAHKSSGSAGTGLGLAISKAIIDRHRGEITFRSEPGHGTCFSIRLPVLQEAPR